jgi:hypothetical protein
MNDESPPTWPTIPRAEAEALLKAVGDKPMTSANLLEALKSRGWDTKGYMASKMIDGETHYVDVELIEVQIRHGKEENRQETDEDDRIDGAYRE